MKALSRILTSLVVAALIFSGTGVSAARAVETAASVDVARNEQILRLIEQLTALVKQLQAQIAALHGTSNVSGDDDHDGDELEIEVEIRSSSAFVEVEREGDAGESSFVVNSTDRDEIIDEIVERTGISESEVRAATRFETDDDDDDDDDDEDEDD